MVTNHLLGHLLLCKSGICQGLHPSNYNSLKIFGIQKIVMRTSLHEATGK